MSSGPTRPAGSSRPLKSVCRIQGSCGTPDRGVIDRVVGKLMVAIHDRVQCRKGGVDAEPERFSPFNVAFVRYFQVQE
ncbi:hypothetical protein OPV22_027862 [Ensete ventricosum]|uniref:Uncharacterized protein n=1 Tax=Ensete ventricosum TaxID=4639 RepID=A0AAV8Q130_ENSVE|nr:hypothetical protein OPV22_027862 [Ensete ventricosum]